MPLQENKKGFHRTQNRQTNQPAKELQNTKRTKLQTKTRTRNRNPKNCQTLKSTVWEKSNDIKASLLQDLRVVTFRSYDSAKAAVEALHRPAKQRLLFPLEFDRRLLGGIVLSHENALETPQFEFRNAV